MRQQFEVVEKRAHGRIQAVAGGELQGQALGEVAGKQPDGSNVWQTASTLPTSPRPMHQPFGDLAEIASQIAGVVEPVGKLAGDQPRSRIDGRRARLSPAR